MLSDELRRALVTARIRVAEGAMTEQAWESFCERIEDIAARLEHWERSATPGPAARLHAVPDNVVMLDWARRGTAGHAGARPPGDVA